MNFHVVKATVQIVSCELLQTILVAVSAKYPATEYKGNQACNHNKIKDIFGRNFSVLDQSLMQNTKE